MAYVFRRYVTQSRPADRALTRSFPVESLQHPLSVYEALREAV